MRSERTGDGTACTAHYQARISKLVFRSALDPQIVYVHLQAMRGDVTAEVGSHLWCTQQRRWVGSAAVNYLGSNA